VLGLLSLLNALDVQLFLSEPLLLTNLSFYFSQTQRKANINTSSNENDDILLEWIKIVGNICHQSETIEWLIQADIPQTLVDFFIRKLSFLLY
jgi:hypothetical protein